MRPVFARVPIAARAKARGSFIPESVSLSYPPQRACFAVAPHLPLAPKRRHTHFLPLANRCDAVLHRPRPPPLYALRQLRTASITTDPSTTGKRDSWNLTRSAHAPERSAAHRTSRNHPSLRYSATCILRAIPSLIGWQPSPQQFCAVSVQSWNSRIPP